MFITDMDMEIYRRVDKHYMGDRSVWHPLGIKDKKYLLKEYKEITKQEAFVEML